jgi:hypothetical protein
VPSSAAGYNSNSCPELRVTLPSGCGTLSYQPTNPIVQVRLQDRISSISPEHTLKKGIPMAGTRWIICSQDI